jgi:O-antigen/teichoic acid export membrane protein
MSQMKSGAILSYLSLLMNILIALLYTPIILRLLGQSEYGLYALIGSVAAYFNIMDMGLGNTIIRYTARNRASGDKTAESKLNGIFLTLYSVIGIFTILVGVLILSRIETLFGASLAELELEKSKLMVIVLIINFAVSFPLSVFGSIIHSYEKFVVTKVVAITRSLLTPIITLPFLFSGFGSVSMVVITTIINISCLLFNVYYCFTKLNVRFSFGKPDIKLIVEILGYSFFIFINVIVDTIYWNTDQFILGIVAGTGTVAVYAIAMQFISIYKMFSTSISNLFLPKASIMVAINASKEEISNTMIRYGRVQYIILAYILSGFILFGYSFITSWAGHTYKTAYYIVVIVMIPLTIPLVQNFGISLLQAKNLHGFRSIVYIIIAVLKILITIPLSSSYGGIGSAVATAFSLMLGHIIIINIYYHKKIGINMLLFWRNILAMSIPAIISIIPSFVINQLISQNTILFLIFKVIIYSSVFLVLMWYFGFNKYEKELALSLYRKLIGIVVFKSNKRINS